MNRGANTQGYTILEVMIYLVITSMLLVGAIIAVGGQQQKTQFAQAMRDVDSRLQDIANDVSTGYYPNTGGFKCDTSGGEISFGAGTEVVGANKDCIFIGKVMQLGVAGSNNEKYNVFTVVGKRLNSMGKPVNSITESQPMPVADVPAVTNTAHIELTEESVLKWGLRLTRAVTVDGHDINAVGFFSGITNIDNPGGNVLAGAQNISLIALAGGLGENKNNAANTIIGIKDTYSADQSRTLAGVVLCFESGTGGQKGSITLGSNGRGFATTLNLDNPVTACTP